MHKSNTALNGSGAEPTPSPGHVAARPSRADRAKHLPIKAAMARKARAAQGCVSAEQLALQLRIKPWLPKRQESRSFPDEPRISHALQLREYGLSIAADIAAAHGARVQQLPAVVDEPEPVRTARLTRELNDVTTCATEHLSDGYRSAQERADELREIREARAVLDAREAVLLAEDARERAGR